MSEITPSALIGLKILLIGSSSVGKSSLLLRFTDGLFLSSEETQATIGVDYKTKIVTRGDKKYKLSIWVSMHLLPSLRKGLMSDVCRIQRGKSASGLCVTLMVCYALADRGSIHSSLRRTTEDVMVFS